MNWLARLYVWATYRLYNEFAWAYDLVSWLVSLGQWAGWRRLALDYVVGKRVLEVGFGTGELLIEMARCNLHTVGLDLSPAMQRVTTRKMAHRGVRASRVRGVVQRMPFADGCFDTVISTFPAGFIAQPATLREVARLLRGPDPAKAACGGRFIVVGMTADTDSLFLRRAIRLVFGIPAESFLARYEQSAAAAGLHTTVIAQEDRVLNMPVVLAEKCTEHAQSDGCAPHERNCKGGGRVQIDARESRRDCITGGGRPFQARGHRQGREAHR